MKNCNNFQEFDCRWFLHITNEQSTLKPGNMIIIKINAKTLRENGRSMKSYSNVLWSLVCSVLRFRSNTMSSRNIVMWLHYHRGVVSLIFDEVFPSCYVIMSLHDEVSTV